jgi:hypothetical protein
MQPGGVLQQGLLDAETATLVAPARLGRDTGDLMTDDAWFELGDDVASSIHNVLRLPDSQLTHADLAALQKLGNATTEHQLALGFPVERDLAAVREWTARHEELAEAASGIAPLPTWVRELLPHSVDHTRATGVIPAIEELDGPLGRFALGPWQERNRLLRKLAEDFAAVPHPDGAPTRQLLDDARRAIAGVPDDAPEGVLELRRATQAFVDEGTDAARIRANVTMLRAATDLQPPSVEVLAW